MISPPSKKEILQRAALTTAHQDYAKGMESYSFFKTNNRATSGDLVQDTFIKTWSYLVKGGKIDLMKAFLYHVLNQLIIDEYRKRKTTSLDALLEKGYEIKSDHSDRLFNIFDGKAVLLLIQRLPLKYHQVMRMRYGQELSLEEISHLTGKSKNAIAVQLHRGLLKLKSLHDKF